MMRCARLRGSTPLDRVQSYICARPCRRHAENPVGSCHQDAKGTYRLVSTGWGAD